MNLTKRNKIILGVAVALVVTAIVLAVALTGGKPDTPDGNPEPDESATPGVTANIPVGKIPASTDKPGTDDTETGLVVDVGGGDSGNKKIDGIGDVPAEKPDNPVEPQKPAEPGNGSNGGGNHEGGNAGEQPFSCGIKNHKCATPEVCAIISNLEITGSPTCGSKSCPSFYGTDKWGNGGYFPELCPKYDIKKDPLYYCQYSGKKAGDGRNGTCARYVVDTNCPYCGVIVKAHTCHSCK